MENFRGIGTDSGFRSCITVDDCEVKNSRQILPIFGLNTQIPTISFEFPEAYEDGEYEYVPRFLFHAEDIEAQSIQVCANEEDDFFQYCPKDFAAGEEESLCLIRFRLKASVKPRILNERDDIATLLREAEDKLVSENTYSMFRGGNNITIYRVFSEKEIVLAERRSALWSRCMAVTERKGPLLWFSHVAQSKACEENNSVTQTTVISDSTAFMFPGLHEADKFKRVRYGPWLVTALFNYGNQVHQPSRVSSFPVTNTLPNLTSLVYLLECAALRGQEVNFSILKGIIGPTTEPRTQIGQLVWASKKPGDFSARWGINLDYCNLDGPKSRQQQLELLTPELGTKVILRFEMHNVFDGLHHSQQGEEVIFHCVVVESAKDSGGFELMGSLDATYQGSWTYMTVGGTGPVKLKSKVGAHTPHLILQHVQDLVRYEHSDETKIDLSRLLLDATSNPACKVNLLLNEENLARAEKHCTISKLDQNQTQSIMHALHGSGLALIQGGPGTGKTRTLVTLSEILVNLSQERMLLVAPTNAAADHVTQELVKAGLGDKVSRNIPQHLQTMLHDAFAEALDSYVNTDNVALDDWHPEILNIHGFNFTSVIEWAYPTKLWIFIKSTLQEPTHSFAYDLCRQYSDLSVAMTSLQQHIEEGKNHGTANHEVMELKIQKLRARERIEEFFCRTDACRIIVGTTTSTAQDVISRFEVSVLINDDAAQTRTLDLSSAVAQIQGTVRAVIMAGDEKQSPPMMYSSKNEFSNQLETSLFAMCLDNSTKDRITLKTQYRMVPSISHWPNQQFYDGALIDGASGADNHHLATVMNTIKHKMRPQLPDRLQNQARFLLQADKELCISEQPSSSTSQRNRGEALVIRDFIRDIFAQARLSISSPEDLALLDIAVLTPFAAQASLLEAILPHDFPNWDLRHTVPTLKHVHGCNDSDLAQAAIRGFNFDAHQVEDHTQNLEK